MTTTTIHLQRTPPRAAPRLAEPVGRALAGAYGHVMALLSSWMRPRDPSPAEAAAQLRRLADLYRTQPSYAADLRAAADRHDNFGEG
ncbi:hypothetical protein [Piscinibacter sp.]|jgi:hypothetical protein|uniref:hypothetical protein n=1 Tax=Piscinibacter sp. TaxID=1903157 RepID=UPI00355A3F6E